MKPTQALHEAGQSLWLDNITRALLDDGILARYVDEYSVTGLTSNPTIFDKAIKDGTAYDAGIAAGKASGASDEVIASFARGGIDAASLAGELQRQGAEAFVASWQDLLARIGPRHEQLSR
jgi:transaldolase